MTAIQSAGLRLGVDPLGGAGVDYWAPIAERYHLDLTVVSDVVDQTFRFMSVDWDGRIRMDPSSSYCDAAADRPEGPLRHCLRLRYRSRSAWGRHAEHGAAATQSLSRGRYPSISSRIGRSGRGRRGREDRCEQRHDRSSEREARPAAPRGSGRLQVVRRGPRRRVPRLLRGKRVPERRLLRRDGTAWTTDKDGIALALLAAEIMARAARDPGELYDDLTREFGASAYDRVEAPADPGTKAAAREALTRPGAMRRARR